MQTNENKEITKIAIEFNHKMDAHLFEGMAWKLATMGLRFGK